MGSAKQYVHTDTVRQMENEYLYQGINNNAIFLCYINENKFQAMGKTTVLQLNSRMINHTKINTLLSKSHALSWLFYFLGEKLNYISSNRVLIF